MLPWRSRVVAPIRGLIEATNRLDNCSVGFRRGLDGPAADLTLVADVCVAGAAPPQPMNDHAHHDPITLGGIFGGISKKSDWSVCILYPALTRCYRLRVRFPPPPPFFRLARIISGHPGPPAQEQAEAQGVTCTTRPAAASGDNLPPIPSRPAQASDSATPRSRTSASASSAARPSSMASSPSVPTR